MTVSLYKYTGENIRVDKSALLGTPTVITANYGMEGNQNIETPTIIISSSTEPDFNYCYIDSFNRYYYIVVKTWLSGTNWRLNLLVDPLYTYKTDILTQSGLVAYSSAGSAKKHDPRLIYNEIPVRSAADAETGSTLDPRDGGDYWIVLTCRFLNTKTVSGFPAVETPNQMTYLIFSPAAYGYFIDRFVYDMPDAQRVAISKTFVSATVVRWLNLSDITKDFWTGATLTDYQLNAYFNAPEFTGGGSSGYSVNVQPESGNHVPFYQIGSENYTGRRYVQFADTITTYANRKAERLIELPYIGSLNVDIDNLGVPFNYDTFKLAVEISYDFGGNTYVVTPGYFASGSSVMSMIKCRESVQSFSNTYTVNFVTDNSYQAETETRTAQLLSLLGTAATGVITAVATNGATIPGTAVALGLSTVNMSLTNSRLQYQQAASMVMNGSSNGGATANAQLTISNNAIVKPVARLYKHTNASATDPATFQTAFGKPDGGYRSLSTLTGFCQLSYIVLTGITGATNNEKNEIKAALLSGVVL